MQLSQSILGDGPMPTQVADKLSLRTVVYNPRRVGVSFVPLTEDPLKQAVLSTDEPIGVSSLLSPLEGGNTERLYP